MYKISLFPMLFSCLFLTGNQLNAQAPAPDFTITTSDGQVKKLYQDYINQQKLVVIEAFFTSCPPCATHAPLVQNLYNSMLAAHPGKIEFILLSTLNSDTNLKVAQYKTSKGLTMPGAGKDGGSITALQPYLSGQFGPFQGTPTFIVIAPGTGTVYFDIRGNSAAQTIDLLQQKIEELFPKDCSLEDPFGTPLDQVQMTVAAPGFDTTFFAENTYNLSQVASLKNTAYTLKPFKAGIPLGLTTYDLVLISKHILGITPFNCPWQLIAADVNCTQSVTTFDILTGRKVILGIQDSFPCGAWRFMPDSTSVSSGGCQDFVGVRLGDVNAGPCTDSLVSGADSRSSSRDLFFHSTDFQPGETKRVSLFFGANIPLDGLQLAFDFDPNLLKIHSISSEVLEGFDSESFRLSDQGLAISWIHAAGQQIEANSNLLTLEITALQGGNLSGLLHLSPSGLASEAYGSTGQIYPLQFSELSAFQTCSIIPNPAAGRFSLQVPVEKAVDLLVQMLDIRGRIVFERTFAASKGLNQYDIEAGENPNGVYFIKVNGEAAGKVILGY
jgi:peroxiredoxin